MKARVTAQSGLRIRAAKDVDAKILHAAPYGTILDVLAESAGWSYVRWDGVEGWSSSTYLAPAAGQHSPAQPKPGAKPKPRLARSLVQLRAQANALAPRRKVVHDGWIGDAAHAARKSEHNPDEQGVVRALDLTHDPDNGLDAGQLAAALVVAQDERILYVIWSRRIWRSYDKPGVPACTPETQQPERWSFVLVAEDGTLIAQRRAGGTTEFGPGLDAAAAWERLGALLDAQPWTLEAGA